MCFREKGERERTHQDSAKPDSSTESIYITQYYADIQYISLKYKENNIIIETILHNLKLIQK